MSYEGKEEIEKLYKMVKDKIARKEQEQEDYNEKIKRDINSLNETLKALYLLAWEQYRNSVATVSKDVHSLSDTNIKELI